MKANLTLNELDHLYCMQQATMLLIDSQEIAPILDNIGLSDPDITGVFLVIDDFDQIEKIFLSESSRPHHTNAIYHPLEYYGITLKI